MTTDDTAPTPAQKRRLAQMKVTGGVSYLADEPSGARAAHAWWRVMSNLEQQGIVVRVRDRKGRLLNAFRIAQVKL